MNVEDAVRRLEDAVDIMTDMAHIRRDSHTQNEPHARYEISPAVVQEAIEGFDYFDKDNDRGLNIHELGTAFRAMGQNPTGQELVEILQEVKTNDQGLLEREEFTRLLKTYVKPREQVEQELRDAFRIFDKDGSGNIDMKELEVVLKTYGEPLTHRQAKELLGMMDVDGNGQVDIDDFVKFLCEVSTPDYFQKAKESRKGSIGDTKGSLESPEGSQGGSKTVTFKS